MWSRSLRALEYFPAYSGFSSDRLARAPGTGVDRPPPEPRQTYPAGTDNVTHFRSARVEGRIAMMKVQVEIEYCAE